MALSALISDFLEYLEFKRNVSPLTIRNYSHYLKRFLEVAGDIEAKDIDLNLITRYQHYLSNRVDPRTLQPLKKNTQNYFLIALRSFLRYLANKGLKTLEVSQVKLQRVTLSGDFQALDETMVKALLEAPEISNIKGLRDLAIMETLLSTGLLVSEITSLNRTLNLQEKRFMIVGKGGKEREVFLSDSACKSLETYLGARKDFFKPLFIRFQGKIDVTDEGEAMRLTPRSIERIVEKYVKKSGFSFKVTPQTLRHTFATH